MQDFVHILVLWPKGWGEIHTTETFLKGLVESPSSNYTKMKHFLDSLLNAFSREFVSELSFSPKMSFGLDCSRVSKDLGSLHSLQIFFLSFFLLVSLLTWTSWPVFFHRAQLFLQTEELLILQVSCLLLLSVVFSLTFLQPPIPCALSSHMVSIAMVVFPHITYYTSIFWPQIL